MVVIKSDNGMKRDNRRYLRDGADIDADIVCDVCGKKFSSEISLKMHKVRAHRSTSNTPSPRDRDAEPSVPDALELLRNQLLIYGLGQRSVDAVIDYMKSYHVDDLEALSRALTDVGMPANMKRLFFESWIRLRGLSPPIHLLKKLGITSVTHSFNSYDATPLEHQKPSSLVELINGIVSLIKTLKDDFTPQAHNGGNNEVLQSILKENERLRNEISKLREEMVRKELESLKAEIQRLKENGETDATIKFLDRRFASFEKKTDELLKALKPIVRVFGERVLKNYAGADFSFEKVGEPRVTDFLPPEYVEEEKEVDGK